MTLDEVISKLNTTPRATIDFKEYQYTVQDKIEILSLKDFPVMDYCLPDDYLDMEDILNYYGLEDIQYHYSKDLRIFLGVAKDLGLMREVLPIHINGLYLSQGLQEITIKEEEPRQKEITLNTWS